MNGVAVSVSFRRLALARRFLSLAFFNDHVSARLRSRSGLLSHFGVRRSAEWWPKRNRAFKMAGSRIAFAVDMYSNYIYGLIVFPLGSANIGYSLKSKF